MGKNTFTVTLNSTGQKKSALVKIKPPKDIVMFVAGTTDPLNTKGLKHEADASYWRVKEEDLNKLWKDVKALKPQFLDLHIEDEFYSWTGDNGHEDRVKGAERLLDLFLRVYKNWTEKEVFLHLIGHSHGGNVINEFTDIIAKDKNFPKHWKIKTLTYLSTPFFKKQHQLNHDKIHPDCKVINVHNEYDITQRFVADFTLKNLEVLIENFNGGAFDKALERLKEPDFEIYVELGASHSVNNHTEGPHMWRQTVILLDGIDQLMKVLIDNVKSFETTGLLSTKKN